MLTKTKRICKKKKKKKKNPEFFFFLIFIFFFLDSKNVRTYGSGKASKIWKKSME